MTLGEASEIVTQLAAAWPNEWRQDAMQDWVFYLGNLDYQTALEATDELIRTSTAMPSRVDFGRAFRKLATEPDDASEQYEHDPHTPSEWAAAAEKAREWRATQYPNTPDPAADTPLPRNRREFGVEWSQWFMLNFGWMPGQEKEENDGKELQA